MRCGAQDERILQLQLAGDLVDDVVSSCFFRLDIDLAGLDAHLVGGAVICLGAVDDIGDVILLVADLYIQLRSKGRTSAAGGSFYGLAGLGFGCGGLGCGDGSVDLLFGHSTQTFFLYFRSCLWHKE